MPLVYGGIASPKQIDLLTFKVLTTYEKQIETCRLCIHVK